MEGNYSSNDKCVINLYSAIKNNVADRSLKNVEGQKRTEKHGAII